MEQDGRYRSRIGKPSGLRPPSARGAAAAASACPAAQGIAPCPSSATASPTRVPQIQSAMPRRISRLAQPSIQRAVSPPRTRAPSPQRREIPRPTGLRPPSGYAAASRLSSPRAIPQPKPKSEAPTASTVPVGRVVSPPRAPSPERTLAVPIPKGSPEAAAAIAAAAAIPPQRRIPMPSRLRRPAVKTERLVAVPVVQPPGSPPKRILVPESVIASGHGTIVAVRRTPPLDEVDSQWARVERLSMESDAAAPCTPRSQATAAAPCSPRRQATATAPCSPRSQATAAAPCTPRPQATAAARCSPIKYPESPGEAAALFVNVAATSAQTEKEKDEEMARTMLMVEDLSRTLWMSPETRAKYRARRHKKYGRKYAGCLPPDASPTHKRSEFLYSSETFPRESTRRTVSPTTADLDRRWEALQHMAAEVELIENEEMPEYYSPPAEPPPSRLPRKSDWDAIRDMCTPARKRYLKAKKAMIRRKMYGRKESSPEEPPSRTVSPRSANLDRRWEELQRLAVETALIEDEEMPEYYSPPSEGERISPVSGAARRLTYGGENLSTEILSDIEADSAFVLAGIVEAVAQEEEAENAELFGGSASPELVDLVAEDAPQSQLPPLLPLSPPQTLPPPLKPRRVKPLSRRHISPTLRSPIDSPPRYPPGYLRMVYGVKSPKLITSPFRNPPQETPLQEFINIDDLEAFLAGTLPIEDEELEEAEGTWEESDVEQEDIYKFIRHRK